MIQNRKNMKRIPLGIGFVTLLVLTGCSELEENRDFLYLLGQTLAVWGASEGSYLMLPLMGPSSGRDITSPAMSMATNPLTYIASVVTIPVGFLKAVNSRANLLDATRMRDQAALDPYTFVREAWRQKRNYDIFDGNPPTEDDNFDQILDGESDIGVLKVY